MKKIIISGVLGILTLSANAQTVTDLKKETASATETAGTSAKTTFMTTLKEKLGLSAKQIPQVEGLVSKLDFAKLGADPKTLAASLLKGSKTDISKILSAVQLKKLKALAGIK